MKKNEIQISAALYQYILSSSLREHEVLKALREETARDSSSIMQIPPEQGQFMALLLKLMGAKKTLEIGTYTGYSALGAALAMSDDSITVTCDINENWTGMAQKYWKEAGVADKIDLKIGPALETLEKLLNEGGGGTFDFAFIDADKSSYDGYYEGALKLLRPGGLMAIDNVFLFGSVVDPELLSGELKAMISATDINAIRALNEKIKCDERVDLSMLPVADGLTLVLKK
ncbi:O-methyltransferase, family 3 [hydrothermal vent metagenome]|uniref:O-methyltransferase, family 3 n=1 Tax=hydrothermal vent metagenome TaxID=652676 RepID=A0A3B0WSG8_9ZZZZ